MANPFPLVRGRSPLVHARYLAIIANARRDPMILFTLPKTTQRIVAYLAYVAPQTRRAIFINRAANSGGRRATAVALGDLLQRGLVERVGPVGMSTYRLAPALLPEVPHA